MSISLSSEGETLASNLGIFNLKLLRVAALHISMPKHRLSLQVPV